MRANKGRDTAPEIALRQALYAAGLRYRVNMRPIHGSRMTVDVAFTRARVAVEVRGCFWHGCSEHHRPSRRNAEFWSSKIADTIRRDEAKRAALESDGWELIVVWEHDDVSEAAGMIGQRVAARRHCTSRRPPPYPGLP
jgi:DNA mismatch endonuclease (patch repair protein)